MEDKAATLVSEESVRRIAEILGVSEQETRVTLLEGGITIISGIEEARALKAIRVSGPVKNVPTAKPFPCSKCGLTIYFATPVDPDEETVLCVWCVAEHPRCPSSAKILARALPDPRPNHRITNHE